MAVRVLRLLEYVYDTPETMVKDMERWQIQRVERHGDMTIRSTTLPAEILTEESERIPNDSVTLPDDSVRTTIGRMGSSEYIKFVPEDET